MDVPQVVLKLISKAPIDCDAVERSLFSLTSPPCHCRKQERQSDQTSCLQKCDPGYLAPGAAPHGQRLREGKVCRLTT